MRMLFTDSAAAVAPIDADVMLILVAENILFECHCFSPVITTSYT